MITQMYIVPDHIEHPTVFSEQRIVLQIHDNAAGPYLGITAYNDEPEMPDEEHVHELFLNDADEVDEFAKICKDFINQAVFKDTNKKKAKDETQA
jgi:hypothetical protein